jgi:hypothetical protein
VAARFDVAARLAEGLSAVDDAQTLVLASQLRGYQHPDLTRHGAQVREWYSTEDGLDLGALDEDCSVLGVAAQSTAEAVRVARAQAGELSAAWSGEGGFAATQFIERHCADAGALATAVEQAAAAIAALRDALWAVVDTKVDATVSVIDAAAPQSAAWLVAARAVIAGADGGTQAGEIVDGQVKPFVQENLQGHWLDAVRTASAAAESAYRSAITAVDDRPRTRFAIPGDLGPRYPVPDFPAAPASAPTPAPAAGVSPVAASAPAAAPAVAPASAVPPGPEPVPDSWPGGLSEMGAPPMPMPMPAVAPPPAAGAGAMPDLGGAGGAMPGLGGTGGAMPDLGAAAGIPARMADALGGLLGSSAGGGLPDPPELPQLDKPDLPEKPDPDDDPEHLDDGPDEPHDDPEHLDDSGDETAEDEAVAEVEDPDPGPPAPPMPEPDQVIEPAPAGDGDCADTAAPAPVPVVEAPPPPVGSTPCEIAADELPQAGE